MIFGDSITPAEKEPLTEMLFKREASLAWDFLEIERVKTEVTLRRRLEPLKKPHDYTRGGIDFRPFTSFRPSGK